MSLLCFLPTYTLYALDTASVLTSMIHLRMTRATSALMTWTPSRDRVLQIDLKWSTYIPRYYGRLGRDLYFVGRAVAAPALPYCT